MAGEWLGKGRKSRPPRYSPVEYVENDALPAPVETPPIPSRESAVYRDVAGRYVLTLHDRTPLGGVTLSVQTGDSPPQGLTLSRADAERLARDLVKITLD